jgi:hypothetical protein
MTIHFQRPARRLPARKVITRSDIDELHARGDTVLCLAERSTITDEARERAQQLHINVSTSAQRNAAAVVVKAAALPASSALPASTAPPVNAAAAASAPLSPGSGSSAYTAPNRSAVSPALIDAIVAVLASMKATPTEEVVRRVAAQVLAALHGKGSRSH